MRISTAHRSEDEEIRLRLNDAPRRWWQVVDEALLSYGLVPTRADRCADRCRQRIRPCPRRLRRTGDLPLRLIQSKKPLTCC